MASFAIPIQCSVPSLPRLATKTRCSVPSPGRVATKIRCSVPSLPRVTTNVRRVLVAPLKLEDDRRPPTNLYTAEAPHTATILSVEKISGPEAANETYNIVFDHRGFLPHWEGQVFGALPAPSENPFEPGDATRLSYFSGASSRYGDYFNGETATLCVRLVPDTTSELLCNSKPGDKFQFTGPVREAMLLGDFSPNATHIFVATGTGVAPFRAHLRRFFKEEIPTFRFSGLAWLFHGVVNSDSQLYGEEFEQYLKDNPENFRYDVAFSRVKQKKYVQDAVADKADEVFDLLLNGAYIYLAGLEDMVSPIEEALKKVAEKKQLDWEAVLAALKANNQWRVEVY